MSENNIQNMVPERLEALAVQLHSVTSGSAYGLSEAQIEAIESGAASLSAGIAGVLATRSAYRAAVQNREAAGQACAEAVAAAARSLYANPAVTPDMIAAAGLAPRSTTRTRIVPKTPTRLVAMPQVSGDLVLAWDRSGNPGGVNFIVESQREPGEWVYLGVTTATRMSLGGYAPGVEVSFRVSASKNGTTTAPSSSVTIYPAAVPPALRLAA